VLPVAIILLAIVMTAALRAFGSTHDSIELGTVSSFRH
jgi:hypothetical protein